ncbi:MAG: glutaredoxin domain-containing protein [Thermodesulfobacteriota bacterium]|nr:glutaredoxin domain-containing protein [Thermodesulfobacteriota bacterium]
MAIDNGSPDNQGRECPKCGYIRKPDDFAPEWQCPRCQIAYEKFLQRSQNFPHQHQNTHTGKTTQSVQTGKRASNRFGFVFTAIAFVAIGYFLYSKFIVNGFYGSNEIIVFFASSGCPPCDEMLDLLDEYGVEYTAYDINESKENMRLFRKKGSGIFPLLIAGKNRVEGFNRTLIEVAISSIQGDSEGKKEDIEIVMYSTSRCGYCRMAKRFFDKNKIEFTEHFIDSSFEANQEFRELSGRGVPLIFVDDIRIEGFNEKALRMALKQRNLI